MRRENWAPSVVSDRRPDVRVGRDMTVPRSDLRQVVALILGVILALGLTGCQPSSSATPPCDDNSVCMTFNGQRFVAGFAWKSPHPVGSGERAYHTIMASDLTAIGSPTAVTPNLASSHFILYQIRGVDPNSAVASDWQGPTAPGITTDLMLWTSVGLNVDDIPGLCAYDNPPSTGCPTPSN